MSDYTFTKLFNSITKSTVWCEPHTTLRVWIAMLADCDRNGCVYGSIPGFANLARVTVAECEAAINTFLSPDPYSRTPDNEGRRIEVIPDGWRLLNYELYRDKRDEGARRDQNREAQQRWRDRKHASADLLTDADKTEKSAQEEAEEETDTSTAEKQKPVQRAARFDDFWAVYPNKKGKQEAEKRWRKDGLDAIADQIIAHVRHMAAHDDAWRRGFEPMGSTYLNQARWTDEARGAPLTASQQPGKQLQGLMALEGMKHGVVPQRDHHGYPEIGLPRTGAPAIGGSVAGDGVGVVGGAGQRLALGSGRGRAEDSRGVLDLGPDSYCVAESAEDA